MCELERRQWEARKMKKVFEKDEHSWENDLGVLKARQNNGFRGLESSWRYKKAFSWVSTSLFERKKTEEREMLDLSS